MIRNHFWLSLALLLALSACDQEPLEPTEPRSDPPKLVSWADLPGWNQDQHAEVWPALLNNCNKLGTEPDWETICAAAQALNTPDNAAAKAFFEAHFQPYRLLADNGKEDGLITGYYEPLLHGSLEPDDRHQFALYQRPDSLLIVDLDELYPDLKGKRVRGRIEGNKVVPFYNRTEIDGSEAPLKGQELLWVDDLAEAFFLQVQGSGRVELPDGRIVGVGYADQNGHAYRSIGKVLIDRQEIAREDVSLFSINDWLTNHPDQATELLNQNPSYVFFSLREDVDQGPIGSLNTPLTPMRSIAVDRDMIPLGSLIWLDTTSPVSGKPLQHLVFAQDTGGAIKGELRADLFWGTGDQAEQGAGTMKQRGAFYRLKPSAGTHTAQ